MKKTTISMAISFLAVIPFAACGDMETAAHQGAGEEEEQTSTVSEAVKNLDYHVFVIPMENHDAGQIFGDTTSAPYINNTLLPNGTKGTNFIDTLPALWSEPHYIVMEAGRNNFSDHTFDNDDPPSKINSTKDKAHLVTQMKNAGVTWRSYQESMVPGTCPIEANGNYAPKHNPFVFFKDVSGSPPSTQNQYCKDHHEVYTHASFKRDLKKTTMPNYVLITPDLSNDMHDGCADYPNDPIRCGDAWLSKAVPPILKYLETHKGVLFIVWDEGENTPNVPFIALGPKVKKGYETTVTLSHASLVKSVERIFGLSILGAATNSNDLRDIFTDDTLGVANLGDECPDDPNKSQPGVCGCGKRERFNTSSFKDGHNNACNQWLDYDCKRAVEDYQYTQEEEDELLANCSLSCGVCPL